jgi:5-methylthioribose kinase
MKIKFVTSTEALVHGDLHSGSVMVKEGSTFVIDPEFAFYGPMGFDLGALISNFLLAYYSQSVTNGDEYASWILNQMVTLYELFEKKFLNLWSVLDDPNNKNYGEIYKPYVFKDSNSKEAFKKSFMQNIWKDTLGFTGCKMIRRIVGVAHVADLESIEDLVKRSECEKKCIDLARLLVLASQNNDKITSINELATLAQKIYHVRDYVKSHSL